MVIQAYIDDSSEVGGAYVLAGYIATTERWAKFSREWGELLPSHGVLHHGSSNYHFKMSEMNATQERRSRVSAFFRVIENNAAVALSCGFMLRDYNAAVGRIYTPGISVGYRYKWTPFYFAFHSMMAGFARYIRQYAPNVFDEPVEFLFDEQVEKRYVMEVWDDFVIAHPNVKKVCGSTLRFESDLKFLPLQAADFWAWWVRKAMQDGNVDQILDHDFGYFKGNVAPKSINMWLSEDMLATRMVGFLRSGLPALAIYDTGSLLRAISGLGRLVRSVCVT